MRKCKKYKKLIVLLEYEKLHPDERRDVKVHLQECDKCKKYYEEIKNLKVYLDQYEIEEPREIPLLSFDKPSKVKFSFSLVFKGVVTILAFLVIGVMIYVVIPQYRSNDNISNKDLVNILQNFDFYSNDEIFDNIELLKDMEKFYEKI